MNDVVNTNRLFFLHIPKAAGTTFYDILYRNYPYRAIAKIDGTYPVESVQDIIRWPLLKKKECQVIMGHMLFGLHKHFPWPYTYVTFLRDPVNRVISLYNHLMTVPQHPLHEKALAKRLSLIEFAKGGFTYEAVNDQVRRISGTNNNIISVSGLDAAKRNLERDFAFVGLTERFDETIVLMKGLFPQLTRTNYVKKNVGRKKLWISNDECKEAIGIIRDRNVFDIELYQLATERFNEIIDKAGVDFMANLKAYKEQNQKHHRFEQNFLVPLSIFRKIRNKIRIMIN